MTCCVGCVAPDRSVWMGADSAGIAGLDLTVRADRKVFRNGPFLFSITGSFRMGQLLRYALTPPAHPDALDTDYYMATTFIDAVRECFASGGYRRKDNGVETGGTFLVGYRGRLFRVCSDFQIGESIDQYDAIGSGGEVARGALYVANKPYLEFGPRDKLLYALHAAEQHSAGVRGPFHIESLSSSATI